MSVKKPYVVTIEVMTGKTPIEKIKSQDTKKISFETLAIDLDGCIKNSQKKIAQLKEEHRLKAKDIFCIRYELNKIKILAHSH